MLRSDWQDIELDAVGSHSEPNIIKKLYNMPLRNANSLLGCHIQQFCRLHRMLYNKVLAI